MLTKSTPEGARDYLVPSRVNEGNFFALPKSPQLFKQLFMVAGFDRYYQITKCFRDQDLRANRQPEFTQINIETSFMGEQEIRNLFQDMIAEIFKTVLNTDLGVFPVMAYSEAMHRYGSDKPDLRVSLELTELTDVVGSVDFKVFSTPANTPGGRVVALRVPGGADISRGEVDGYTEFVKICGAKGLAWIKVNDTSLMRGEDKNKPWPGLQSPIVKNLHDAALTEILLRTGAQNGDILFFGADKEKITNDAMGALCLKIGLSEFGKKQACSLQDGNCCGWWTSRCSSMTRKTTAGARFTTLSQRPRMGMKTGWTPTQAAACPKLMTWCSMAGNRAVARCEFTALKCKARCLPR